VVCEKIVNQDAIKNNIQSEERNNTQPTSSDGEQKESQEAADQIDIPTMKNVQR
jgi:hypothetical protein